jgi:hypothetical protein
MSGQQARLSLTDIRTGWEAYRWKSFGMPFDEFLDLMLALDAEYLDYWGAATERSSEIGRKTKT